MRIFIFLFVYSIISTNTFVNQELSIEISFDNLRDVYNNEHVLTGKLSIDNNSCHMLVLPKTFDLEIALMDSLGNIINRDPNVIVEYHNLVSLEKSIEIAQSESISIDISEWRLFLFNLKKGNDYYIQYTLNTNEYRQLKNTFKGKRFSSNKAKFTYDF